MKTAAIQKTITLVVISFSISSSFNTVEGQGFFKKLKDAAKKEVNKVITPSQPANTPSGNNQNNVSVNPVQANNNINNNNNNAVGNNLWASDTIPKNVNPVRPQATKAEDNRSDNKFRYLRLCKF